MTALEHAGQTERGGWATAQAVSAREEGYWSVPWLATATAIAGLGLVAEIKGLSVIVFLAGVAVIVWRRAESSTLALLRWSPAFALAFLALLSVLWSEAPGLSFRLGGMLLLSLAGAIVLANRLTPSQFIGAVYSGLMVVVVGSVGSPKYQDSTAGLALSGLAGNKNVLAYMCAWSAVMAGAILLDRRQPAILRWAALGGLPIIFLTLFLTKSAGGLMATLIGLVIFGGLAVLHAISPRLRVLAVIAGLILAVPTALNWTTMQEMAQDFQVNVLKKDHTLTGRTYLWERAGPIIESRPVLGHGYSSFWRQGQLDAEGLWRYAGISDRAGFNFHNEYVDTAVSLGYTGVIILILTVVGVAAPLFVRAIFAPTIPLICLGSSVAPMIVKSFTETGLISYWSISTTILFAGAVYGRRGDPTGRPAPQAAAASPPAQFAGPAAG